MEPPNSFAYLTENLPSWIVRVTDLAAHTATKHAEFSADYSRLSNVKSRRRKNSSVHSIRPDDLQSTADKKDNSSDKMDISTSSRQEQPYGNANKYVHAANRRRRGGIDGGTVKSGENARQAARTRHMVVVHYDSHTQNELEQLVKDIGAARNNLRKSRMARMRKTSMGGLGMKTPLVNTRNFRKPPTPTLDSNGNPSSTEKEPAFDFTDKQLELAQNCCEAAAHQFLRDGDCSSQLDGTREKLKSLLETAKVEAERLEEEEKAKKERGEVEEEPPTKKTSAEKIKSHESAKSPPPGITAIEVDDDSSASSISIDITAFRSTRLRV